MHHYFGDFYYPAGAAYATEVLITKHGADVLAVLQDAFDHIQVAAKYNVPVFGTDAPQNSIAPETIVTITYWGWGPMLTRYIDSILANAWSGEFTY